MPDIWLKSIRKAGPASIEETEDEELRFIQDEIIEQRDDVAVVATFPEENKTIYSLCVQEYLTQTEAAKSLGKSYVSNSLLTPAL